MEDRLGFEEANSQLKKVINIRADSKERRQSNSQHLEKSAPPH